MYMLIVIAAVLVLGAGVFYVAMVVSGKQDDTWPDEMASGDKSRQATMDIPKRFLLSN